MALLEQIGTGLRVSIGARCLVGRSRACALMLDDRTVSGEHAVLFHGLWGEWVLRDLGSRNGTWVDGLRVHPTEAIELREGHRVRFGGAKDEWLLIDLSPPGVLATGPEGSRRGLIDGVLVLPDEERPLAWISRGELGWVLERVDHEPVSLVDGESMELDGACWTVHLPRGQTLDTAIPTQGASMGPRLSDIGMQLVVDRWGQLVQMAWAWQGERHSLPVRACNGVLLELARLRLDDRSRGLSELDCGWVHTDDLLRQLGVTPQKLHVDLLRCRRQLGAAGIADSDELFERRPTSRELRLGVGQIVLLRSDGAGS